MEITMPGAVSLATENAALAARITDLEEQLRDAEKHLAVLREIKAVLHRSQNG